MTLKINLAGSVNYFPLSAQSHTWDSGIRITRIHWAWRSIWMGSWWSSSRYTWP